MSDPLFVLADTSVRAVALASGVTLALAAFRIRSIGARHAAWTVVAVTMLLMPLLIRVVPPVRMSVPLPGVRLAPAAALYQSEIPPAALAPPPPARGNGEATVSNGAFSAAPALRPTEAAHIRWSAIALGAYLLGAACFLVRFLCGLLQIGTLRRSSHPIASLSTPRLAVCESAMVATPVTIGPLAPRVLLPVTWREWPAETLAAVLAHERAHAERRDPLVAVLVRLDCSIFWFHPLAWWLERHLSMLAEHACDDAAIRQVPRTRYAETLLDVAAAAHRHRGRLVWNGVGVGGHGRLARRIDRVLAERPSADAARLRRVAAAAACAVVIAASVACQREAAVSPLREDPELAAKLRADVRRAEDARSAARMTLADAAALEQALEQNPEDAATRKRLLTFYRWTGKNPQPWNDNVAARRRHALWLVEHHPDSELLREVHVTRATDPVGYAQLRERWLAIIAPPDTSDRALDNAARFFDGSEYPIAERIILRAKAMQVPASAGDRQWSARLGRLYAATLIAVPGGGGRPQRAQDAAWARQRLERTSDPSVLFSAGQSGAFAQPDVREFLDQLVVRASRMEGPAADGAREWLRQRAASNPSPGGDFGAAPPSEWPAIAAKSTGVRKLRQLASLAEAEYLMSEYYDWRARQSAGSASASPNAEQDKTRAAAGFARARDSARDAIGLATSLTGAGVAEAAFRAHLASGLVELRQGHRQAAVRHLVEASTLPAPQERATGGWASSALEYRLVWALLKEGERQTIIDYFERAAAGRDDQRRKTMLAAAAAIRAGRMPEHYQVLVANGSV